MLVRELMTPRPEIFAIPESTTIEGFLELLRKHNYSRVPAYSGSLDNIKGLAFAHDLLQITDVDARTRTVATILHPAAFVLNRKEQREITKLWRVPADAARTTLTVKEQETGRLLKTERAEQVFSPAAAPTAKP